jgi:dipeptidyl aminopeptidase/acylaminoacyl peptidase
MEVLMRSRPRSSLMLLLLLVLAAAPVQDAEDLDRQFREVISLRSASSARISPDGMRVAYTVGSTEWDENRFDTEIWLVSEGSEPRQLTRTADGSSTSPAWHPDGSWLAFVTSRSGSRQVWGIRPDGGEAWQVTHHEGGVGSFAFSPDGSELAFTATDALSEEAESRRDTYGGWAVEDAEFRLTHLWVQEAHPEAEAHRLTDGAFTVGGFDWAPDGSAIAFDHRPNPQVGSFPLADISVVGLDSGEVTALVTDDGPDSNPIYSPDGSRILYATPVDNNAWYGNTELAVIPAAGGERRVLTREFDEDPLAIAWTSSGVFFAASDRTLRHLYLLDPDSGEIRVALDRPENLGAIDVTADGGAIAASGYDRTTLSEVWWVAHEGAAPLRLTDMTAQVADWPLGTREVISWTSEDGTEIEGVLYKPEDYDPSRRYPLLVIIHGGPTGTSRPQLVSSYVYPVTQWLQKGAVVLQPNYRGSAGYGEAFRSLNVRNLGVGDMWDVMSGVDHLIAAGIADPDRLGAMGWSQGGYISAFLTTNTDRFKAISVGAGISNWMTYYVNTDIHDFTRQYLQATPWSDPEIYARTSPMTSITEASTPTLIQHGEFDARVPTPNGYELYQGLQDVGVPAELVIYEDFGHGITRPKERLAATWHNWIWFGRYLWGEDWEMPVEATDEE